jgi:hypothetical protein
MSATFASGRIAIALCDRCGQQRLLRELHKQIVDQKDSGMLVCAECLDQDHPQLRLGKTPIYDPQALRNPRPDKRTDVVPVPLLVGYTVIGAPVFRYPPTAYGRGGVADGPVSDTAVAGD